MIDDIVMSYRLWRAKRLVRKAERAIHKVNANAPIEDRVESWRRYRKDKEEEK